MSFSKVEHKIVSVSDTFCRDCWQNWRSECRAYEMPHSAEEREARTRQGHGSYMKCKAKLPGRLKG